MRLSFLIIILVYILGNGYVFFRLWQMVPSGGIARPAFLVLAVVLVSSFFLSMLLGDKLPISLTSFFYMVGTAWFFIFIYVLLFFLLVDILRLTRLFHFDAMRENWNALGVLAGLVTIVFSLAYLKYKNKERIEIPIAVKGYTGPELTVVAVSDLHLGYAIGNREFNRWIELINAEAPDLVVIGGDAIDNSLRPLEEKQTAAEFHKIESKYGVYASLGNHEYMVGPDKVRGFMERAGVNLLRDQSVLIDSTLYIVGRDDLSNSHRKPLSELTEGMDRAKPILVLDHQPSHLEEAEAGNIDIQFSGHTHHGQIWPFTLVTDRIYELAHGYMKRGRTNYVVSSGIGIWGGKFRIGSQSEYVVIKIMEES